MSKPGGSDVKIASLEITQRTIAQFSRFCLTHDYLPDLHKGQHGRIAVVGGSEEYTGAPFFAAMAALKVGADLVHVFCHPKALIPIKNYSPELMVHPLFRGEDFTAEDQRALKDKTQRMHAIVLGPGAGASPAMQAVMRCIMSATKERKQWLICDADVFRAPLDTFRLLFKHPSCILTPNVMEVDLIGDLIDEGLSEMPEKSDEGEILTSHIRQLKAFDDDTMEVVSDACFMSSFLRGPMLFVKGKVDLLAHEDFFTYVDTQGGTRRCGGQGDLLGGCIAACVAFTVCRLSVCRISRREEDVTSSNDWSSCLKGLEIFDQFDPEKQRLLDPANFRSLVALSALIAAAGVKHTARVVEQRHKGYATTSDILAHLGAVFHEKLFPIQRPLKVLYTEKPRLIGFSPAISPA